MQVDVAPALPSEPVDGIAVAAAEGDPLPERVAGSVGAAEARGEVRRSSGAVTHLHDGGVRIIVVGLGGGAPEDVRVAAAHAQVRARELGVRHLHWLLPAGVEAGAATAAIVEGTLLRAWEFDAPRREPREDDGRGLLGLTIVGGDADAASAASTVASSANWARTQQHEPPNVLTPTELGRRASALRELSPHLQVEVQSTAAMRELGMGAFLAVAQGSDEPPALITARYRHPNASGPRLALVGKAVTFDSGGISIKPSARMHEMKFDMSGGAVVLGALRAACLLDLPLDLDVVVGATENLPSGGAVKPGDIVTAADGTTIEITNTDAEGRLVLADCVWHAREQGATAIVDVATLTGAVSVALGSTHAGLIATDDALADELLASAERTGELAWRLPMHPEYAALMKSQDADVMNGALERKAGTITGGWFISRFAGDVPWAHLDIAGTAWSLGRAYAPRGGAAYGLRLLVDWLRGRAG